MELSSIKWPDTCTCIPTSESCTASWLWMLNTCFDSEFTKTNLAPFSWTHLRAQPLWSALIPLAPQPLSLIQPVQVEVSGLAAAAMLKMHTNSAATPRIESTFFICVPSQCRVGPMFELFLALKIRTRDGSHESASAFRPSCGLRNACAFGFPQMKIVRGVFQAREENRCAARRGAGNCCATISCALNEDC